MFNTNNNTTTNTTNNNNTNTITTNNTITNNTNNTTTITNNTNTNTNTNNTITNTISNNTTTTNNNNTKPIISISTIGRILKKLQLKSLITLKSSKLKYKHLNIENEDKLKKSRDFSNSYSKPWNFEEHFIGDINMNMNKKIKNNKTKLNKLDNLKKQNKLIQNKAKLTLTSLFTLVKSLKDKENNFYKLKNIIKKSSLRVFTK